MMGFQRVSFLKFIELMVYETNEQHPLSKHQLLRRMEDMGYFIHPWTFDSYVQDMKDAGLTVRRGVKQGIERNANLYWYDRDAEGSWI